MVCILGEIMTSEIHCESNWPLGPELRKKQIYFSKLILDCLDLSADLELTKIDEPRSSSVFHKNISFKNCGGWARKPPQNAPSFQQVLTSKH